MSYQGPLGEQDPGLAGQVSGEHQDPVACRTNSGLLLFLHHVVFSVKYFLITRDSPGYHHLPLQQVYQGDTFQLDGDGEAVGESDQGGPGQPA